MEERDPAVVDEPPGRLSEIAATGDDVYIAYTDGTTGEIRFARSNDRGANWTKIALGTSTVSTSEGRSGLPSVAANGSTVVVAWVADSAGTVKARVSTNRGSTWGTAVTIGSKSKGMPAPRSSGTVSPSPGRQPTTS